MLIRTPDYYPKFQCLAGACPHSCCEKWEVVIDQAHAELYAQVPGALGEKLRSALQCDEEGDLCFPLHGGRCPFLDEENLCQIHRELGQEATSITCQEHPRFTEDYGSFREVSLAASCPAANSLLLGSEEPLGFVAVETDEAEEEGDGWLAYLHPLRSRMLQILGDRETSLHERLRRFLLLAAAAQPWLDAEEVEMLSALAESWQPEHEKAAQAESVMPAIFRVLSSLEVLEEDWPALLQQAAVAKPAVVSENLLERVAVYFAFRYLLKCINDADLLSRAQLCVMAVLVVERLAAAVGLAEALRRLSCEIEHSEENLEALLEAFRWEDALNTARFLAELQRE